MNVTNRDLMKLIQQAESRPLPQKWRPEFHLAPPVGWLNDPNGLCRIGDTYHVFYQYAPFEATGGMKTWGHFQSTDLVNWIRMPTALLPDEPWDCHGVYSGSALSDGETLRLYYTGNVKLSGDYDYLTAGREHNTCLAVSWDGGRTFPEKRLLMKNSDYPAGLTCHVRDPKVWKDAGRYYMTQGARTLDDRGEVLVFTSSDGLDWTHTNTLRTAEKLGYMWECPDFFRLNGQAYLSVSPQGVAREETRLQNLYQSGYFPFSGELEGTYELGNFIEYDYGFDFYAPQTFDDNGRRLLFGWMGMPDVENEYTNPTAALGWQHILTVPRELFRKDGKLCQRPVPELEALRGTCRSGWVCGKWTSEDSRRFDLVLQTQGKKTIEAVLRHSARITWENGLLSLRFNKAGYGRTVRQVKLDRCTELRILADESSLEIFVNGGEIVLSTRYYPEDTDLGVELFCADGQVSLWDMHTGRQ